MQVVIENTTVEGAGPTVPSYMRVIADALSRYPDREAFVGAGRRLTYAQSADLVSRFQQVLHAKGLRAGQTMVVLSPNAPETYLAQVAAGLSGCRYSGLHPLGSVDDHVVLCDDADAAVLVVHPAYAETGAAIAARASTLATVLTLGPADVGEDLLALAEHVTARPLRAPAARPGDAVWLPYTGGTTGRSKGVVHTHAAMIAAMHGIGTAWELPARPRYLASAPITHASVLPIAPTLVRGGTVVLLPKFTPDEWLATVVRERIDYAFVVPTMLYALLDHAATASTDLSSLETVTYGASPMSEARLREALEVFGPVLMQGYGQTETLGLGTTLRKDEHNPDRRPDLLTSCGRPVPGAQVELVDAAGDPVPDGEVGEFRLQADFTMTGYWNQPQLTADTLRDGWLHTGDLAVRDESGFLHIVDRKKDLIISGAFNIYPSEIEQVLAADPEVSAAAVIGVPDEKWGEAVTAFVVARPSCALDPERLRLLVRDRKGAHQTPKTVHVVDALPTTPVGKIDKKALRARFWTAGARAVN
ncbi:Long-chain-fatty-acid--CoA ligase [Paraconexibacter sp. AEG42_29]|uniref:Long-chain-fatty-acid--CoA ligase n=1 Tax=Paraconexibacter sp. AEG42_29 TaxID=2997339 RepID=A0AAU7AYI1_9ACTN